MKYLIYIIWIGWVMGYTAQAQHHISYYQKSDGLPANLTKVTTQDKHGFIWIATDLGLVRFDGKRFDKLSKGLPSPYVKGFFTTRNKQLVAITDGGLVELITEPDTIGLKPYIPLGAQEEVPTTYPRDAFTACDGSIWLSEGASLLHLQNKDYQRYSFEGVTPVNYVRSLLVWEQNCGEIFAALPTGKLVAFSAATEGFVPISIQVGNGIKLAAFNRPGGFVPFHALLHASDGRVVIASGIGLLTFRIDAIRKKAILEEWNMRGVSVSHVIEAKSGHVYATTFEKGVYHANSIRHLEQMKPIKGLPFHVTKYLYEDYDGNIWVNGDGGVILLHPQFFKTIPIPETMRAFNYFIGEDGEYYMLNDSEELFRAVNKEDLWTWKRVTGKFFSPGNSPLFTEHSRMAIYNDSVFTMDSVAQSIRVTANDRTTRLPVAPDMPAHGLVKRDKFGNLWITFAQETWMRKPNGEVKKFTSPVNKDDTTYVFIGQYGKEVYMSRKNRHDQYLFQYDYETSSFVDVSTPIPDSLNIINENEFLIIDAIKDWKGDYWLATGKGLYRVSNGVFSVVNLGNEFTNQPINMMLPDNQGGLWIAMNVALIYYKNGEIHEFSENDGLPTTKVFPEGLKITADGTLWVATPSGISFTQSSALKAKETPAPIITSVQANGQIVLFTSNVSIEYNSYVEVSFTAPTYPSEKVQFRYRINHRENTQWVDASHQGMVLLPQMKAGLHQLEIQAKQQGNYNWSKSTKIAFEVVPIWYDTWWGIGLLLLGLGAIIFISIKIYSIKSDELRRKLQQSVENRTEEINMQKEEIMQQRDNLQQLHNDLKNSLTEIQIQQQDNERKNKNITDSINYASRIQLAMLPSQNRMTALLPKHFVFYQPRDIVSGDFYWCNAIDEDRIIIAVADCTGHGVPGAFMSLIGSVMLEQIIFIKDIYNPAKILEVLNNDIQKALNQEEQGGLRSKDGMDISICVIDQKRHQMQFAGAKSQMVFVKDEAPHRVKGDNKAIGGEYSPIGTQYTLQEFDTTNIDSIYLFSDGYQDQFGGPDGKKFMSANFRKMMIAIQPMPMEDQLSHLKHTLNYWMNPMTGKTYDQIDDILVVGIRLA